MIQNLSLKKNALKGGQWTSIAMMISTLLQLLKISVLARYLSSDDFGLMAIVMVLVGFSQAFADMGISNAIIHRQNITHDQLSSLYWLNLMSGIALALVLVVISPFISLYYSEPDLVLLTVVVSSVFVITAFGQQYRILCQKELQFATIALITITSEIIGTSVAIWLAWSGMGVWSLVISMLVTAGVASAGFLLVGLQRHHRPSLVFRYSELKGFYGFGLYQMGERSINYLSANIDKILIGKFVGMGALGFYNMASQLALYPLQKINPVVNTVAFPTYAKLQHDPERRSHYYAVSVKLLSLVTVPILAFLFFNAHDVVLLVFGDGWSQTAALVQVMVFIGVLKAVGNPGGALLLAMGRAEVGFWWNLAWVLIVSLGLYIGLVMSPSAESAVYVLLGLSLTVGMVWHILIARIGALDYKPVVVHLLKIFVVAFAIGAVCVTLVGLIHGLSLIARIGVLAGSYGLLYGLYLMVVEREFLLNIFRNK